MSRERVATGDGHSERMATGDTRTHSEELAALKARVAMLEAQVAETEAWANRAVAEAQAKTYWLDRWHLDLNSLMRRRSADRARAAVRAFRPFYRGLRKLSRRFRT
jgi:hypothetical protein